MVFQCSGQGPILWLYCSMICHMTCYLLVYDHLSLQIIQMDISNVSLCSQRYVLCMRKPTRFFPIYQRGDLQYPSFFHPSRSRVPSPSTRRTRWWFAIWVVFLRACVSSKKNETEEFFTLHHHKPPSFFCFFFGGPKKKQWKFGNHPSFVHPLQLGSVSPATLRSCHGGGENRCGSRGCGGCHGEGGPAGSGNYTAETWIDGSLEVDNQ